MVAVNLRVSLNADLILDIETTTVAITAAAFRLQQGTTIADATLSTGISVVGTGELHIEVPLSRLSEFVAGPAEYDVVVLRGGKRYVVQYGGAVIVPGFASIEG